MFMALKLSSSMIERAIKTITLALKIVSAFLKNCPKKLFSNCLVDGLLTFIVLIFKHSKCCHSLLQVHLRVCNTHF